MSPRPAVSVLITTYNRARYLPLAVQGALSQTVRETEILILDDASTDDTLHVVQPLLEDPRVFYFRHGRNLGINANRNFGLARARGEFIAMLDSDDLWLDERKLEKQLAVLRRHPRCGLVGSAARVIDENGNETGELNPLYHPADIRNRMLVRNQIIQSAVVMRKSVLDETGGYDPDIPIWEDYELWLRIGSRYELRNIPEPLTGYRVHSSNISRSPEKEGKSIASYKIIYNRYRRDYPYSLALWLKVRIKALLYGMRRALPRPARRAA